MIPKPVYLTREGYEKLVAELERLRGEGRQRVAELIKYAREFGDISENAEYDAAKEEQARLEARIAELEERLSRVELIEEQEHPDGVASLGSKVWVKDPQTGQSHVYVLVGSAEADPSQGKISIESPVGKALLGAQRNQTVKFQTPSGKTRTLEVTKVA